MVENPQKRPPNPAVEDDDLDEAPPTAAAIDKDLTPSQLENYIDDIADTVRVGLDQSIAILTPWFFNNMPKIYYQTTPRQEKVRHLSAIITGHVFETKQTVELWDRDRSKVTYIGPGGGRDIMLDMANKLKNHEVEMGAVYFSRDRLLFLSTFFCEAHSELDRDNRRITEKIEQARASLKGQYPGDEANIDTYVDNLSNEFVMYATSNRLSITYRMVKHMLTHEGAHTFLEPFENSSAARLTLGIKNVNLAEMLESIFHIIFTYDFSITRAFMVRFSRGYRESIGVMHLILNHASGDKITADQVPMIRLIKALRTLGWVDHDDFSLLARKPHEFSINAVNLVRSMATWCHIFLSKKMPYAFSIYRIRNTMIQYDHYTREVVRLFRLKFDPMGKEQREAGELEKGLGELEARLGAIPEDVDRAIFSECVNFINHCLKTNYFFSTKTGHCFRMAPEVLDDEIYKEKPFGFYFISGRDFRAFQVRWKDVARGGMRVVIPRTVADYDYALAGLFDEVYGLSFAQQLKNKDIPEGGSKAVLVLKPGGHRDQAFKGAVNALLDLLVEEEESHESLDKTVTYYPKSEIIYLGPDENVTNELINWIPMQAKRRNYRYYSAFMSSKPGAGINHKEYGVTSEGVNVFVENALYYVGIDPRKESFTVKLTGGPDGDVAGNELKILNREYGDLAKVVMIADGLGCAYDPDGLDWNELLGLVERNESIVHFPKDALKNKQNAYVIAADSDENIRTRNELFFKVNADVFIPAGGRPYTVNDKNWEKFIDKDGRPSQAVVVEGANIFFTNGAREKLQEYGVLMVKDSSANKTGVICSSYEIMASLTMDEQEFIEIKDQYVREVVAILRKKADDEAKLLFREHSKRSGTVPLVNLSLEISREINHLTDFMLSELETKQDEVLRDPAMQAIILRHCPPVLVENYRDRIFKRLPAPHQLAIVASHIASYVVYREGLGWLSSVSEENRAKAMLLYMEKDELSRQILKDVAGASVGNKDELQAILSNSAARELTVLALREQHVMS